MINDLMGLWEALEQTLPGKEVVYYVGTVLRDDDDKNHSAVSAAVFDAYERGVVEIYQRRLTQGKPPRNLGVFAYCFVKRREVVPPRRMPWRESKDGH